MLFPLGEVVITPAARAAVPDELIFFCLARHWIGDWGVPSEDKHDAEANDRAVRTGNRLLSAYPINPDLPCKGWGENCLWIITEADRSSTTILLPDDY